MPRKRMIDPTIWEDEHFGALSDKAKILFISCISNADDDGRLSANASNLRAIAFRFEDISVHKIGELLDELAKNLKNCKVYEVNGCKYIQLQKWEVYQTQRDERRKPSKHPPLSAECQPNVSQVSAQVKLSKDKLSMRADKCQHLDFVYLTNKEFEDLTQRFGGAGTKDRIANLNHYIGSKGDKYKSHYHTILNWARKEGTAQGGDKPKVRYE